jgi:hypothetical protein
MQTKSLVYYYEFGQCTRYLQDALSGTPIHEDTFILTNIKAFLKFVDDLGLTVTSRTTRELIRFRDLISNLENGQTLNEAQAKNLRSMMLTIRSTLTAELTGFETYIVTPKIIDVDRLLHDVGSLFAPDIFWRLPEIAQYDFTEAGKCIAFERPTAAAFHVLRGTEAVLREYYCFHVRQKRIRDRVWGEIVKDLRRRPKTKGNIVLHNNLDNIRLSFRNPTQHPEMKYDISEVQDLFNLCVEVVNRMGKTLPEPEIPF